MHIDFILFHFPLCLWNSATPFMVRAPHFTKAILFCCKPLSYCQNNHQVKVMQQKHHPDLLMRKGHTKRSRCWVIRKPGSNTRFVNHHWLIFAGKLLTETLIQFGEKNLQVNEWKLLMMWHVKIMANMDEGKWKHFNSYNLSMMD